MDTFDTVVNKLIALIDECQQREQEYQQRKQQHEQRMAILKQQEDAAYARWSIATTQLAERVSVVPDYRKTARHRALEAEYRTLGKR
jgi:hypothetical protein